MTDSILEDLKYPIGKYVKPEATSSVQIKQWINDIAQFPIALGHLLRNLNTEQLHWPYRPLGWNIKQVVHHCADSHMNAFIRVKLALTENSPTIKPYYEDRWSLLIDNNEDDLSDSLHILKGVHAKLGRLLNDLKESDFKRDYIHPEYGDRFRLDQVIALYSWHCKHHLAHIEQALKYQGNF